MASWRETMKKKKREIRSCPGWLVAAGGFLLGALVCGVGLALIVTFWLKSTTTTSTTRTTMATSLITTAFVPSWSTTGITVAGVTGMTGVASHLLSNPYSVAVDASNNVYVVDESYHRVQRWTPGATNGTTVVGQANGVCGIGLNFLCYPSDVTVDTNGNLYVADGGNHRVIFWNVATSSGSVVAGVTGAPGNTSNQLWGPLGLTRDASSGTLYIADTKNNRVMRYLAGASSGTLVAGGNGAGLGSTQLNNPRGIHFDASSNSLLIANNYGHNILRWVIGSSTWTLVAGSALGSIGNTPTLLSYPTDVTLDSRGNMYVSDEGNHRIQFFLSGQSNGSTVAGVTGLWGSTAQLFNTPSSVAVDSLFNIYVTDYNNYRVQKFLH